MMDMPTTGGNMPPHHKPPHPHHHHVHYNQSHMLTAQLSCTLQHWKWWNWEGLCENSGQTLK